MSTKHTPEPWKVVIGDRGFNIVSDLGEFICFDMMDESQNGSVDAERIVKCVNAMAGIEDPADFMELVKRLELDQYQALANAVRQMRQAQKNYFATRAVGHL
jgi:hypothetical protein